MSTNITWYFDFISPFAYLQQTRFQQFPRTITIRPKPVLFAALLDHWQHKGPAEIPGKRLFTYQHVTWMAGRIGVPLRMPPAHPFNPLRALRLAVASDNDMTVISRIFTYLWRDGLALDDERAWKEFSSRLGMDNVDELTSRPEVKQQLRQNTDEAIAAGVFGVPTILADGHLFWGYDATDMFLDFHQDPQLFDGPALKALEEIPEAVQRLRE